MPWATSFPARDDPLEEVSYSVQQCTDDHAIYWFHILLANTREDILDQDEADILCALSSSWNGIHAKARRTQDEVVIGQVTVHLTPRAGVRQRRRSDCIIFDLPGWDWAENNWLEVERRLEVLAALQFIVLVFDAREILLQFLYIALPFMHHLSRFPGLILAYPDSNGWSQVLTDGHDDIREVYVTQTDGQTYWKQYLLGHSRPPDPPLLQELKLTNVPFKSFEHLVWLIRAMPSLQTVNCEGVMWETLGAGTDLMPPPTSFLTCARGKPAPQSVRYRMKSCTDNRAAFWLAAILGLTKADTLDRTDMNALCAMVSAWRADDPCSSARYQDAIGIGHIRVFLTSRIGTSQPQRIRSIAFVTWESKRSYFDLPELDKQVKNLSALQAVLYVFRHVESLLEYRDEFLPLIPRLGRSSKLKLVLKSKEGFGKNDDDEYIQVSLKDYWIVNLHRED
ncbi:hypothetical protein NM688_g7796 [Phlebia brevispora]|uniref:Uncharacterized protein n=1 Tax=Phlebia brevispora TaxID=194682 RepID=A0ACC1S106_9APHY|nr:hypothetical protein NM688_g7796 [Phlebia brevispora]